MGDAAETVNSNHSQEAHETLNSREENGDLHTKLNSCPLEEHDEVKVHQRQKKKKKKRRQLNPRKLPLDGRWGWAVMIGCCLMHFLVGGLSRSYGLIYIQLRYRFASSASVTAWVGGTASALRMGLSPISTALSSRFGERNVIVAGGLISGAGYLLSAFTPNTQFMFFSYALLTGFGGCLAYAPSLVLVGQYFKRYRAIAIGLACSGSGIGCFCFPPFMAVLFDHYGYQGTCFILSGIVLHLCLCGVLHRPLEDNEPLENTTKGIEENTDKVLDYEIDNVDHRNQIQETNVPLTNLDAACKEPHPLENNYKEKKRYYKDYLSKGLKKHMDLRLCSDPVFVVIVVSFGFITMSYTAAQMLIPDLAKSQGYGQTSAVFLLSILGISDMTGRLSSGFIFDAPVLRNHRLIIYSIAILLGGITNFVWAYCIDYTILTAACVVHGIFIGCVVGQRAVILSDFFSVERLGSSFGITVFVQGCGLMIGPTLAGFLRDQTGGYMWSYMLTGILALAGWVFFIIGVKVNQLHRSPKRNHETNHPERNKVSS